MKAKRIIKNWGGYPEVEADVIESGSLDSLYQQIQTFPSVIARGNGRCYGDSSLNSAILSTLKLNKVIEFNIAEGILCCQSGVLLSDILNIILPKGFFLPVTPGTKFITVGGAIAADVHGKNHHKDGCFSSCVQSMDILGETGVVITCTPTDHADLFWATCGGMGLTGIILKATIKLLRIETSYVRQKKTKAQNLEEIMALFEENRTATYTVAWIDCLATGEHIGRSIFMQGEHAKVDELPLKDQARPLPVPAGKTVNIPCYLPGFLLNRFSIRVFNSFYYGLSVPEPGEQIIPYEAFFYPLDAILNWNRMYGRRGFTQYQFVLPIEASAAGLREILTAIAKSGEGSFLAVLKLFGAENSNAVLSFPKRGYTLALDFKISSKVFSLLSQLDSIVLRYGGRLYLAKDSRMSSDFFHATYEARLAHSPFFQSLQSKRLTL